MRHRAARRNAVEHVRQRARRACHAADVRRARADNRAIRALCATGAELQHSASLRRADDAVRLRCNQRLVVNLQQQIRLNQLRLNRGRTDGQQRFAGEHGRAFRDGVNVAVELEILEVIEEALVEDSLAAQISDIIIGEMQLLDVLDNLLQPRGNREAAAVGHVAEEHVKIHIALVEAVAVVAIAHCEFVEITEHRRVFLRSICHCFAHPVLSYLSKFVTLICSPRITSSAFSCSASSLDAHSDASTDTRASGSAALHSTAFEITQMFVTTPTSSIS